MRFEVISAVAMTITFFWDVSLCSMVNIYSSALKMEAVNSSETSVNSTIYTVSSPRSWQSSHRSKVIPIPLQLAENDERVFRLHSI
jgi:hypothetical protein